MDKNWNRDEAGYCYSLVCNRGDDKVGRNPKTIASYLRVQACAAFRDEQYEVSARLGTAATAVNEDARNDHAPDWGYAAKILEPFKFAYDAALEEGCRYERAFGDRSDVGG